MITHEKLKHHWDHLRIKHNDLDKKIKEAYDHYDKDEVVHKMKIEKLHIKEEMNRVEKQMEQTE
jgi:uncharacterized protein YdcH (DUF465 family)